MFNNKYKKLTDLAQVFLTPANSTHRQYEALRALCVEGLPSQQAARRFGYSPGSFRVLTWQFRQDPHRAFFLPPAKGPHRAPKSDPRRLKIVQARKQNLSIYDISRLLQEQGHRLSPVSIARILKEEGFARLPRRADEERPSHPRPETAPVADARLLDLSPCQFRTQFGGLFLFVPYLSAVPWDRILKQSQFPGTQQIPAAHAMRSLLGLKLYGSARHSHADQISRAACKPVILGIPTSRMHRSGREPSACSTASTPSDASATTSRSGWRSSNSLMPERTMP